MMQHRAGALLLVCLLTVLSFGTGARGAAEAVKNPDTFLTLSIGDPQSLDPAFAYDTSSAEIIWPTVYETLITYSGSSIDKFVPILATQVPSLGNHLISADGLTYTFPIRKGVKFHDGTTMTPEDVRYSILRFMLQDPDGGPASLLLTPLTGKDSTRDKGKIAMTYQEAAKAVAVQGDNVVFHLVHPFGAFLSIMAAWSLILPKAWAASHGDWDGGAATWQKFNNPKVQDRYAFDHMNGTGPFKLQEWDRQAKQVVLVRNDSYWRKPARLARVVVRTVPEFTTRRLQLQQGDADYIDVSRSDQSKVEGMAGAMVRDGYPTLTIDYLSFTFKIDPTGNPDIGSGKLDGNGIPPDFFTDAHLRRAFAYAFDYGTFIRDAWRGKAIQPNGPIPQGMPGYDPSIPKYAFNKDKATAEFKEAWGGKVWSTGFKFTMTYNSGNVPRQIASQILKDSVESLNPKFKIDVRNLQFSSFLQLTIAHKGTMFALGWAPDYPDPDDYARPFMASNGDIAKRSAYSNPDADKLVNEAAALTDIAKRTVTYRQLSKLAYDDVPALFIDQRTNFYVMRSWVHGWYYNPLLPHGIDYYAVYKG
jgi:peptide/nickel transport system substrate-binding protein